jgi:hypothetical protein
MRKETYRGFDLVVRVKAIGPQSFEVAGEVFYTPHEKAAGRSVQAIGTIKAAFGSEQDAYEAGFAQARADADRLISTLQTSISTQYMEGGFYQGAVSAILFKNGSTDERILECGRTWPTKAEAEADARRLERKTIADHHSR